MAGTDVTERQLTALLRVVRSMNLVNAHISVAGEDDLLSREEMLSLELSLMEILRERENGSGLVVRES